MTSYPVFLTCLDEQRALVVGAGPAAERKVQGLLDVGAQVTLIASSPSDPFRAWADEGRIEWLDRGYRQGDVDGAALVIVTEAPPEVKTRIWDEARRHNVLINITGSADRSTFANGATLRRGPLVISVSTSGAAPTLSVRLRDKLADEFGPEYEEFLDIMKALRDPMQENVPDFQERRERWYSLVDSNVLDLLAKGHREEALAHVESVVGREVMDEAEGGL